MTLETPPGSLGLGNMQPWETGKYYAWVESCSSTISPAILIKPSLQAAASHWSNKRIGLVLNHLGAPQPLLCFRLIKRDLGGPHEWLGHLGRVVSDSDPRVPAELGQESQASSCLRKGTPLVKTMSKTYWTSGSAVLGTERCF